jgi:hypothetical protein
MEQKHRQGNSLHSYKTIGKIRGCTAQLDQANLLKNHSNQLD